MICVHNKVRLTYGWDNVVIRINCAKCGASIHQVE